MWKKLDDAFSTHEGFSRLSVAAALLYFMLLPFADCTGRYPAIGRLIKAQVLPLRDDITAAAIDALLDELDREGLVHRYDSAGARFLVFHYHERLNPQANLRHAKPKYPAPPTTLCECVTTCGTSCTPFSPSRDAVRPSSNDVKGGGNDVPYVVSPSPSHLSLEGGVVGTSPGAEKSPVDQCVELYRAVSGTSVPAETAREQFKRPLARGVALDVVLQAIRDHPGETPWAFCDTLGQPGKPGGKPKTELERNVDGYFAGDG